MNLVTMSIHRPVPVVVLFVALTLAGFIGFTKLGVQDRPDMDIPIVTVSVNYPGVPPSQLETEVTRKIEDSVATTTGIDHIRSTVTEGLSTTTIEFQLDRDVNEAVDDVRDSVTRIRSNLPGEIEEPIISRATTAGSPVVTYGVSAPGMSVEELSWFVDLTVSRELSSVDGMGAIKRVGGVEREIRVDLDPDALNALGTTAGDVSRQLRRTQVELPGGEARIGNMEQSVRTVATAASVQELAGMPIVLPDNRSLRLDDRSRTFATAPPSNARSRCWTASRIVGFEVTRAVGASALGVADGVKERGRPAGRPLSQHQVHGSQQHRRLRAGVLQGLDAHAVRGLAARDHRRLVLPERLACDAGFVDCAAAVGAAHRPGCCTTCSVTP